MWNESLPVGTQTVGLRIVLLSFGFDDETRPRFIYHDPSHYTRHVYLSSDIRTRPSFTIAIHSLGVRVTVSIIFVPIHRSDAFFSIINKNGGKEGKYGGEKH